ncbi:hypothetical protein diail_8548 [Diaporthe ilicicola]|nr:hypothetical protein diail_8548 [Diaporthe ilicicola]
MRTVLIHPLKSAFIVLGITALTAEGISSPRQEDPYYFTTDWYPRPWSEQFQSWYKKYSGHLRSLSEGPCNRTLHDYQESFNAPVGSSESSKLLSICYQHERCLWDGLTTDQQLNFQSAGIVLGILPTLMSSIGVSISETALLSAHRPVLSLLLSLAAPAIWPTRLFEYNSPADLLATGPGKLELRRVGPWKAGLLSLLEYACAIAAVVNTFLLSWDMGNKTILSWGCTTVVGPLLWTSLATVLHAMSALSYNMVVWQLRKSSGMQQDRGPTWRRLQSVMCAEFTPCANQEVPTQVVQRGKDSIPARAVVLHIIAGCASFVHLAFGTIIFSSLLFISVWDVLNRILWRFVLATFVARLILIVEVAGLRASNIDCMRGNVDSGLRTDETFVLKQTSMHFTKQASSSPPI